jgi:hypothetical protein
MCEIMRKNILFFLLGILPVLFFNSCSKDEDSNSSVKNSLIGAWKTSMSSSNWRSIYIAPNGNLKYNYVTKEDLKKYTYDDKTNTYHYSSDGYGWTYDPNYNAHWAFDETTNSISMYRDDGYYAFTYKVTMNDDHNSWVGVDSKGATYTFTRVEE